MRRRRSLPSASGPALSAGATAGAGATCVAEALAGRLLMALAAAAGGSGYSGQLSSNAAIRKQQLTCDPDEPQRGSTSVLYDAARVTLTGAFAGPGYNNANFGGFVEVEAPDPGGPVGDEF